MKNQILNNIRVTYSGLIALLVSLIGVITGTVFVILITRKLIESSETYAKKVFDVEFNVQDNGSTNAAIFKSVFSDKVKR